MMKVGEAEIQEFIKSHNKREIFKIRIGSQWVRIRPPTEEEESDANQYPAEYMRFTRIGAISSVTEVFGHYIGVKCGGQQLLISKEFFLDTWIQIISQEESDKDKYLTYKTIR